MKEVAVILTEHELKLLRLACDHASDYHEKRDDLSKVEEYETLREKFWLKNIKM